MEDQLTADPPPLARLLSIMDQQLLQTVSQLRSKLLVELHFIIYENTHQDDPSNKSTQQN